jgi:hypothetical protein
MDNISEYERRRNKRVARNDAKLAELGLHAGAPMLGSRRDSPEVRGPRKKRRRTSAKAVPTQRRSRRVLSIPTQRRSRREDDRRDAADQRKVERSRGWRFSDGKWRGERFGHVKSVPCGTVFGAGDYQRQGRFEMSRTGFFLPKVTPEWIDSATKQVLSLIVNNDNGLSTDDGDVLVYAGAGGRRRGQNRTAAQSFHQTWQSATNAAFRASQRSGAPVRVIRGPKCRGAHGTSGTGGGYRYDGLYVVESAELVARGPRGLRTALFTLRKLAS